MLYSLLPTNKLEIFTCTYHPPKHPPSSSTFYMQLSSPQITPISHNFACCYMHRLPKHHPTPISHLFTCTCSYHPKHLPTFFTYSYHLPKAPLISQDFGPYPGTILSPHPTAPSYLPTILSFPHTCTHNY